VKTNAERGEIETFSYQNLEIARKMRVLSIIYRVTNQKRPITKTLFNGPQILYDDYDFL